MPPIYQPEVAARAVVYAADHPGRREYWVGASTAATLLANAVAPGLLDRYLARTGFSSQQTGTTEDRRPAGQPVGSGGWAGGPRLRRPRDLRRRVARPLPAGVGLSAPSDGRGGRRSRVPGRCTGRDARRARPPMRTASVGRLGLGSALLAAPGPVLDLAGGPDRHDDRVRMVSRVLGGRLVLQAVTDVVLRGRFRRPGMAVERACREHGGRGRALAPPPTHRLGQRCAGDGAAAPGRVRRVSDVRAAGAARPRARTRVVGTRRPPGRGW